MDNEDYLEQTKRLKRNFLAQIGRANSTAKKEMINEFDKLSALKVGLFSVIKFSTIDGDRTVDVPKSQPMHQMPDGTMMLGETHQETKADIAKRLEIRRIKELELQKQLIKEQQAAQQSNIKRTSTSRPSSSTSVSSGSSGGGGGGY